MIGKVQQDSFPCLRIRLEPSTSLTNKDGVSWNEPAGQLGYGSPARSPIGESLLPRDCQGSSDLWDMPSPLTGHQTPPPRNQPQPQQQSISRYKTELCRPYQEHGVCKYGEKCQFAHGQDDLRTVNRHPKYKTDMCRTYHSVGFCPYGPRCHFIHGLEEMRISTTSPSTPDSKKSNGPVKQLPMFGGSNSSTWSFPDNDMKQAVNQLNNFFNMSNGSSSNNNNNSSNSSRRMLNYSGSSDSSRSGSFCSDLDSPTSSSPPPSNLRLPIFSKLA